MVKWAKKGNVMKHVLYDVVKDGDAWAIECDGKKLHQYASLPEAEAAMFDMARTDKDRGHHVDLRIEGSKHGLWDKEAT